MSSRSFGLRSGPIRRGLYVGRFQPFHLGHVAAMDFALGFVPELIVGIASIESNLTWKDPFSCRERIEMIWDSLGAKYRDLCLILPVPNQTNNILWLQYVLQYLPRFEMAFTNNPVQTIIMQNAEIPVEAVDFTRRNELRGSLIRELIASRDRRWLDRVPVGTRTVLLEVGAEERLCSLQSMELDSLKGEVP